MVDPIEQHRSSRKPKLLVETGAVILHSMQTVGAVRCGEVPTSAEYEAGCLRRSHNRGFCCRFALATARTDESHVSSAETHASSASSDQLDDAQFLTFVWSWWRTTPLEFCSRFSYSSDVKETMDRYIFDGQWCLNCLFHVRSSQNLSHIAALVSRL